MSIFFEVFPLFAFLIAYYTQGIFAATAVAIGLSALQVVYFLIKGKKPPMMTLITLGIITVFGGATLWFENDLFIKLKSTLVYWCMALAFVFTHRSNAPLALRMIQQGAPNLVLSLPFVRSLNAGWAYFMFVLGVLNLIVLSTCDTKTWVNYKIFGSLTLLFSFVLYTAWRVHKHLEQKEATTHGLIENA